MTAPRWLWISGEISATPSTGLLVYSSNLVSALAGSGVAITMVGIGNAAAVPETVDVRPVEGSLRGGVKSLASTLPNLSFACATPQMRAAVEGLLNDGPWDAVIIDHLQTAWVAPMLPADVGTSVFITHNHEGSVRRDVARQRPVWTARGLLLRIDAWKAGRLERAALDRADVITSITEADRKLFEADAPTARHVVAQPGWSGEPPSAARPLAERPRRVGIVGSFEWHVKQDNLANFVAAAGPQLAAADIELLIGGRMPGEFASRLMDSCDAVTCIGWVDSVSDFLGECRIGAIAEPLGGGFKLKSLDYIANGVPVAATTGSLEGLPLVGGTSMIEADDARHLGRQLVAMIDDPERLEQLAKSALSACSPTLRWEEQVDSLMRAVAGG